MGSTILFGVNVAAIFIALLKLLAGWLNWKDGLVEPLRALVLTVVVVLVGLQAEGIILPPASERWVLLTLTALSTFLVSMGYLPEAKVLVRVCYDLVRWAAFDSYVQMIVKSTRSNEESASQTRALLKRYRLDKGL
jgi:hypothetical protein